MTDQCFIHNQRCSYTHGFYCEDCRTFFDKNSFTYRSSELLTSIGLVMININVDRCRAGKALDAKVLAMEEKLLGTKHDDYEALIAEAEIIMSKHGVNSDSATVVLS